MIVNFIKNVLFWFLALIILTIPLFFLFVWKCLIILFVKIIHPSWSPMKVRDTMAIGDQIYKKPLLNVGLIVECKGLLEVSEFREHFCKCLLEPKADSRTEKPLFGNFFANLTRVGGVCFKRRIDPNSAVIGNLKNLIYQAKLEERQSISDFIVKFFYAPHDESGPLWKIAIVQQPLSGNTVIFFKIHHSLADGYSLIYIFDKLTNTSTASAVQPFNESCWDKVKLIAGAPVKMQEFGARVGEIKTPLPPMSGINTQVAYSCFTLDLELVKRVRRKTGARIAPILLTLQGGVIRKLLLEKNNSEDALPAHLYSGHSLPWPDHPRNKMCNEWTVGMFKVPIKNPDPLARLRETDKDYTEFQDIGLNRIIKRLMVPLMWLLPVQLGEKMGEGGGPMSTSWSSILAGNDYVLLEKPIEHIYPFVGHTVATMALGAISLSHSNKIDVTMVGNLEFIQDGNLDKISDMIQDELKSLVDLAEASGDH